MPRRSDPVIEKERCAAGAPKSAQNATSFALIAAYIKTIALGERCRRVIRGESRKSGGRKHPETSFPHSKLDRAVPDQLAIDLDRHLVLGGNTQAFGLKVLQLRHADGGAEDHILQVTNNVEITDSLKDDDIEQAVVDKGAFEERERSTIKATISDEDEGAFHGFRAFRFNDKMRGRAGGDLRSRNKVTERAEAAFEGQACLFHRLGIESNA